MAYYPIYNAFSEKPLIQRSRDKTAGFLSALRDNFSITTWLLIGAFFQGLLTLLPYRNIALVAPAALALGFLITRSILMAAGLLKNVYMDGAVNVRTAAMYPNQEGEYEKPADQPICCIMLAARANHPLGLFSPGYKVVGDFMDQMLQELEDDPTPNGFLGCSSWTSNERRTNNEAMVFLYFDSPESVHNYAHGPLHTKVMEWWRKEEENVKHIGIMHEIFACPKNAWEGVYLNYHPTGLGATIQEATVDGKKVWVNPLVYAKGKLTYSKGRMGRPFGEKEWPEMNGFVEKDTFAA